MPNFMWRPRSGGNDIYSTIGGAGRNQPPYSQILISHTVPPFTDSWSVLAGRTRPTVKPRRYVRVSAAGRTAWRQEPEQRRATAATAVSSGLTTERKFPFRNGLNGL